MTKIACISDKKRTITMDDSRPGRYHGILLAGAVLFGLCFGSGARGQVMLKAGEFGSGGAEMAGGTYLMNATVGQVFGHVSYSLTAIHGTGLWYVKSGKAVIVDAEDDGLPGDQIPEQFELDQNYPNPFNPATSITYGVPEPSHVRVSVYNMLGRLVKVLVDERRDPGYYTVKWDGTAAGGVPASSGLYIYVMQGREFRQSRKMVLIK